MNRKPHGMQFDQLVDTFGKLFGAGHLIATHWPIFDSGVWVSDFEDFVPTRQELERGLRGPGRIDYKLTAEGGAAWEAVAKPDWDCYAASTGTNEYASCNRAILEEYLTILSRLPGDKHLDYTIEEQRPFYATYWKTFPMGFQLKLDENKKHTDDDHEPGLSSDHSKWFTRVRSQWYTNPFSM
jgi:hypothetical protein